MKKIPPFLYLMGMACPAHAQQPGTVCLQQKNLFAYEWNLDHDQDGQSNAAEYAAGTDPFDPNSYIKVLIRREDQQSVIFWNSNPGSIYQVRGSSDLQNVSNGDALITPVAGNGMMVEALIDDQRNPRRFFTLQALPPTDEDNDGLSSVEEALLGTLPDNDDTDGDTLPDGLEVTQYFTDPLVFNPPAGTLRGNVVSDLNGDGDLSDGLPLEGTRVYLDANFNGRFDSGERFEDTDAAGDYEFQFVSPGLYHVRQHLPAPNIQTFPVEGAPPNFNFLPDEVTEYVHAAEGVGNFDVPYGENGDESDPTRWGLLETTGLSAEPVDSVDLVLKPIGVRNRIPALLTSYGSEFLSLPKDASITLRFDEVIVDGPGPDLLIYSINASGAVPEAIEVLVGKTADDLTSIGIFSQSLSTIAIDLGEVGYPGPVRFVKCISQNNGGDWLGFELVGMAAVNIAPPESSAYIVEITNTEVIENLDFGRYFRDLPPTLILGTGDGTPSTPGLRSGESLEIQVRTFDDFGIAGTTVIVNGVPQTLDPDGKVTITTSHPGTLIIEASTTDTAGNTVTDQAQLYILNPDGSLPFDPDFIGPNGQNHPDAPTARILSPTPGTSSSADVVITADIFGSPSVSSWTLEYAPVNLVEPYNLAADDPDYLTAASGTADVFSGEIATLPLSTLPDGVYFVRLKAQNSPLQTAYFGQVIAKNVPEADLRPQITITSPALKSTVMITSNITGTITSTRPLREWFVEYAPAVEVDLNNINAPGPNWKRIAGGTGTIPTESILATFDGTLLKSDRYIVRIVANNEIGLGQAEPLVFEVTGDAKLGRNRLEFTDLELDLVGFPLRFTRVYDSLQADEDGELGFGWSLELQDADIRETVPDTGSFGIFGATPFRDGTRVYITAPTGERLGFTFKPEFAAAGAFTSSYRATFIPDPGVYHRLEVPEGDQGFLSLQPDGTMNLVFFAFPWNPEKYILIDPQNKRFTYHEDLGFLQAEDPNGNTITLNENGIDHSTGSSLRFERDARGRITKVTDPANNSWQYGYDANGNLTLITSPEGDVTTYTYSSTRAHYLTGITDPQGRMPRRYEYDPDSGRLVAIIDEAGNRKETTWDIAGFQATNTDARGNMSVVDFDSRGNITREEDVLGNVTTYEYADAGNPDLETKVTDPKGHSWNYEYDDRGNPIFLETPVPGFFAGRAYFGAQYDDMGNLTRFDDLNGNRSFYEFDDRGNRISERPVNEIRSDFEYDSLGNIVHETNGGDYQVDYFYDEKGFYAGRRDILGDSEIITNSPTGQPLLVANSSGTLTNSFTGNREFEEQVDPAGSTTTFVEEADGKLIRTDRTGNSQVVEFDADERITGITTPNGGKTGISYDPDGNPAVVTDPLGNATKFTYDHNNLLTKIEDAAAKSTFYTRDSVGNPTEIIDRNGRRRTFEYDAGRRPTVERWHNPAGEIIREIVFTHEPRRSFVRVDDTAGNETVTFSYNGTVERPISTLVSYPGQDTWTVTHEWNDQNEFPVTVALKFGFSVAATSIRAEAFANRPYNLIWAPPGSANRFVNLKRRPDGKVTRLTRFLGTLNPATLFSYDAAGRVTTMRHEDASGALVDPRSEMGITYDREDRILGITQSHNDIAYTYDDEGQLTGAAHSAAAFPSESYTYDLAGNRTSGTTIGTMNRITAAGEFTYLFDNEGNVTRRTHTASSEVVDFSYDHRNRLVEISSTAYTIRYQYDYLDRVISREKNGQKIWIYNDRTMPLAEIRAGETEVATSYFYDLSQVDDFHAVWTDDLGERWFLKDQLGSIRGTLDGSGNFLSWIDYDSFGQVLDGSPGSDRLGFAGRFLDSEVGLYQNRRRFYSPALGRFLQEDPTKFGGRDSNLYRYVYNQPINLTDPSGEAAALENAILFVATKLTKKAQRGVPCNIAIAVNASFSYFDSIGAIIENAGSGKPQPALKRSDKKVKGCQ